MQFSNGQFFPIRFWRTPHFAGARTPSGKGYARGFGCRMMRARKVLTQWTTSIRLIDNGFRKVEKTRIAILVAAARCSKAHDDTLVASGGPICANMVVRYNQL